MSVQISDALTIYAVGSAVAHTAQAFKWLYNAGATERAHYIAAHVHEQHQPRLKFCQINDCMLLHP